MERKLQRLTKRLRFHNQFHLTILQLRKLRFGSFEEKVDIISRLAAFNWSAHSGRYTSSEIDRHLSALAAEISECEQECLENFTNRIVFVASQLYTTGGHTRLLENIASFENNHSRQPILLLTCQNIEDLPNRISNSNLFSQVLCLGRKPVREKIFLLRSHAKLAEKIYNFQHPDDPIPSIALDFVSRPFCFFVNHADHVFSLGTSFCDAIINIRPFAQEISETRRNATVASVVLPVKLKDQKPKMDKAAAKRSLGLNPDTVVLLTVSEAYKIIPDGHYNFFQTIGKIITQHPETIYYFVGITESFYTSLLGEQPPPQLKLLGRVEEVEIYQAAADIYLEGMPWNSLTALMEAVYAGAYPVLMWGPYYKNVNMNDDLYLKGIVAHPENEEEYLQQVASLLKNPGDATILAKISEIKARIEKYNGTDFWERALQTLTKPLVGQYMEFARREEDLHLVEWQTNNWKAKDHDPVLTFTETIANKFSLKELWLFTTKFVLLNRYGTLRDKIFVSKKIILHYLQGKKRSSNFALMVS